MVALLCGVFLLIKATGIAQAAPFTTFAVGPYAGTPGIGVQISTPLAPGILNLTAGYSAFGFSYRATSQGQGYNAHFRVSGAQIYLSGYPVGPHFHLDAGIFVDQNRISISAVPSSGSRYAQSGLGPIHGETHYRPIAPYLGIGWGNPFIGSRWTLSVSAGVIIEGGANTRLDAAREDDVEGAGENIAASQGDFNRSLSFMSAYPVASIGLSYRF